MSTTSIGRAAILIRAFGDPADSMTTWGMAKRYQLEENLAIIDWPQSKYTAICFIPAPHIDARRLEWRATDRPDWFRMEYPEFIEVKLSHLNLEKEQPFREWVEAIVAAVYSRKRG